MICPSLSPIDDDGVLTLVLLDSTHPQIISAATELNTHILKSANRVLELSSRVRDAFEGDAADECNTSTEKSKTLEGESKQTVDWLFVDSLVKDTKRIADCTLKLTIELDDITLPPRNPIWGSEKSVRQSRRFLVQLLEKITERIEKLGHFLRGILEKLPNMSLSSACSSDSNPAFSSTQHGGKTEEAVAENSKAQSDLEAERIPRQSDSRPGRGRGILIRGAGRGAGMISTGRGGACLGDRAHASSVWEGRAGISPNSSDASQPVEDNKRKVSNDDLEREQEQKRWKRKPASNTDWMLKCKTKVFELRERTARKAISDVFITERMTTSYGFLLQTVAEAVSLINHNATKLEVVSQKDPSEFTDEEYSPSTSRAFVAMWRNYTRRVFMQSIESHIAGLEKALFLLAKETLNKRQLMSLYDSAAKVERLSTPAELLTEM